MEELLRKGLLDHMTDNGFISDRLHGFVQGRPCTTQLMELFGKWTEILDGESDIDVIYLDLAETFDSVSHCRLLSKPQSYGMNDTLLDWIKDFLLYQ